MKKRFNLLSLAAVIFSLSLFVIISCTKEKSGDGTNAQQETEASQVSSQADGEAEIVFNDVFDNAMGASDEVGVAGVGVFGRVTACHTVTVTHLTPGAVFPIRIVIDFGTTGCIGPDGRTRRGKIITEYTGRLMYPGTSATTTFDGYYVDSVHVEGTHTISNTSTANTQPVVRQFKVDVVNAKLTRPNGNYTKWNSHKKITQMEGTATSLPLDDIFKVEGSASGQGLRGNLLVGWESVITEPLVKRYSCRWIVKGKVRTVRVNSNVNSPWVAILDFGAGTCDNQAVVTINGIPHQITLP